MTRKTSTDKDGGKASKPEGRDYMKLKKILEDFVEGNCNDYNEDIDCVIHDIAITGIVRMPWKLLKPLLRYKIDKILTESFEETDVKDDPPLIQVMELLDKFSGPPFTIQRVCELVKDPCKCYRRRDKYIRALHKNLLVVTTLEPDLIWMKVPNLSALLDPKSSPTIPLPTPPSPSSITDKEPLLSRDLPSPTWKFPRSPISPRSPRSPRSRTPPPDFDSFTGRNWEGLLEPHPILFKKRAGGTGGSPSILKETPPPVTHSVELHVQLQEADSTVPDQPPITTTMDDGGPPRGLKRSRSNSDEETGILKNILSSQELLLKTGTGQNDNEDSEMDSVDSSNTSKETIINQEDVQAEEMGVASHDGTCHAADDDQTIETPLIVEMETK